MNNDNKTPEDQAPEKNEQAPQEAEKEQQQPVESNEPEVLAPVRKAMPAAAIEDSDDAIAWLKENATPILVGLVIAALAYLGVSMYRSKQKASELAAQNALFGAQQSAQLADVLAKYPKTSTAALAELTLASQLFDEGKYDQARASFAGFLQKNPGHVLAASAEIGLAKCDEAQAKYDAALTGYDKFLKTYKDSYILADAVFGKARCLAQVSRFDDARTALEDFIAGNPQSPWINRAQTELAYVGKAKRQASAPAAVPVTVAPPVAPAPAPAAK